MILKNFFQSEKIVNNLLMQFCQACQEESIALKIFQKFENFFCLYSHFSKNRYARAGFVLAELQACGIHQTDPNLVFQNSPAADFRFCFSAGNILK